MHRSVRIVKTITTTQPTCFQLGSRFSSNDTKAPQQTKEHNPEQAIEEKAQETAKTQTSTKTQAQLDDELRLKMSGLSGDGGEAGIEYEDGQPVAMKRSVKNNMFRYI